MPSAVSASVAFLLFLLLLATPTAAEGTTFRSTDGEIEFHTTEVFRRTANPHAILALQAEDDTIVLVTMEEKKFTTTQLYDGLPGTFEGEARCLGRVLLSVDGEEAPTFMVEGMFPPDGSFTHDTLYTVSNHGENQYTIMIHYPVETGDEGFERATRLLEGFRWVSN